MVRKAMKAKIDTAPEAIFQGLRKIAPDIAFSLYWAKTDPVPILMTQEALDEMLRAGYREYVVEASALTVLDEEVIEAKSYMTGFFYRPGELDPDLDGFLPELLLRATRDLSVKVDFRQAEEAVKYLEKVRRARAHQRSVR